MERVVETFDFGHRRVDARYSEDIQPWSEREESPPSVLTFSVHHQLSLSLVEVSFGKIRVRRRRERTDKRGEGDRDVCDAEVQSGLDECAEEGLVRVYAS